MQERDEAGCRQPRNPKGRRRPRFGLLSGVLNSVVGLLIAVLIADNAPRPGLRIAMPPAEVVFARQDALLDAEFQRLSPQQPGKRDLYMIGLAGYGGQGVFMREVDKVTGGIADRLAGPRRAVRLINHPTRAADTPMASASNLAKALQRLARVMDLREDVLLLFLTSHGSPGQFAIELEGMPLMDLDPGLLRALLDQAGIVNRVVVISACFSGSFVEALESPDTLVITAARDDRSSFGCTDENEWTWFGDAYFNRALARDPTLIGAFGIARDLVSEWEKTHEYKPSEPQIAIGARIRPVLEALERPRPAAP